MSDLREAIRALAHEEFLEARERLVAVVADRPDWADAWALLSGAQLALAEVDAASAAVERALALEPGGFLPQMKAGELALRLGHLDVAEERFLAAVRATGPEGSDAAAARKALAVARRATRVGIVHRAALPSITTVLRRAIAPVRPGFLRIRRIGRSRAAREAI